MEPDPVSQQEPHALDAGEPGAVSLQAAILAARQPLAASRLNLLELIARRELELGRPVQAWAFLAEGREQIDVLSRGEDAAAVHAEPPLPCSGSAAKVGKSEIALLREHFGHLRATVYSATRFTRSAKRLARSAGLRVVTLPWLDTVEQDFERIANTASCEICDVADTSIEWHVRQFPEYLGRCEHCRAFHFICPDCASVTGFAARDTARAIVCKRKCGRVMILTRPKSLQGSDLPVRLRTFDRLLRKVLRSIRMGIKQRAQMDRLVNKPKYFGFGLGLQLDAVSWLQHNGYVDTTEELKLTRRGRRLFTRYGLGKPRVAGRSMQQRRTNKGTKARKRRRQSASPA
jgi:hypothetical protein